MRECVVIRSACTTAILRDKRLKRHRARLLHILGLLKQREEIEQRMLRTAKKVEDASMRGKRCLESSLVARLEYLKDLIDADVSAN